MHIRVLGSAAGGGFPQWNCNCRQCAGLRNGSLRAQRRTQSSIALSDNGVDWVLCNASPDIRAQLESFPTLQPARRLRDTAIAGVVLLDSQIDHCTGLLSLREGRPHSVWCTERVHEDLSSGFPLFTMLKHWNGGLQWQPARTGPRTVCHRGLRTPAVSRDPPGQQCSTVLAQPRQSAAGG